MQERLARGAQGEVWVVVHEATGARLAWKVWRADLGTASLELLVLARLGHPCVVGVHDFGVVTAAEAERSEGALAAGAPWVVLDLASGGSLRSRVATLDEADLVRVLVGVLDGLAHAHARDVLHLDVKPGNVLLRSGHDLSNGVCLTDFGVAQLGRPSALRGYTHGYAPPEQIENDPGRVGPWSDVFAAGRMAQRLARDPATLADWIARATQPSPADRFADAARARAALPGGSPRRAWYPTPPALPALGPALLRHRVPLLRGRSAEMRRLRAAWETVRRRGESLLAVVAGPCGSGVTFLLQTFARSVRELGEGPDCVIVSEDSPGGLARLRNGPACLVVADMPRGAPAHWPPAAVELTLRPLGRGMMRALVASWLPLRDSDATALLDEAEGLPGRAHRLLCNLAARDELTTSDGKAWARRAGRPIEVPPDEERLLAVATAWGADLTSAEWRSLASRCRIVGSAFDAALEGLVRRADVSVRGIVWRADRAADPLPPDIAAVVLGALPPRATLRRLRLRRRLDPAGAWEEAVAAARAAPPSEALPLWIEAEAALDAASAPPADPRRAEALDGQVVSGAQSFDFAHAHAAARRRFEAAAGEDEDLAARTAVKAAQLEPRGSERAERWLTEALARATAAPTRGLVWSVLGAHRVAQGRLSEGVEAARLSAELDPRYAVSAWCDIGNAHLRGGDGGAARAAYLEALRLDPTHPRPAVLLGDLLKHAGRLDEARAVYVAGLRSPNAQPVLLAGIRLSLAHLEVVVGDAAACVEQLALFDAAVPEQLVDMTAFAQLLLSLCAALGGESDEARRRFALFEEGDRRGAGGIAQPDVVDALRRLRAALPAGPFARRVEGAAERLRARMSAPPATG